MNSCLFAAVRQKKYDGTGGGWGANGNGFTRYRELAGVALMRPAGAVTFSSRLSDGEDSMTSTEKTTTAVEQALFRRAEDGTVSVVSSSLGGEQAERAWLDLVGRYLPFGTQVNSHAPVHAFR
jgi:hypothetical protein